VLVLPFQTTPGINTGRSAGLVAASTASFWFQSTPGINTGRSFCGDLLLKRSEVSIHAQH